MRYLITTKENLPFFTKWFDPENHFNPEIEMTVYDLIENGKADPKVKNALKLAKFFKMEVAELFCQDSDNFVNLQR